MSNNEKILVQVVDTKIFEKKLQKADAVLPFVLSLLTTKKAIANFLEVTPLTVSNMIKDGRLKESEHYYKDESSIVFIANAIIEYKINPPKKEMIVQEAYQPSQEALNLLS